MEVGVNLVFCQGMSACPLGFLGHAVFIVLAMGPPVSGRNCVLPLSAIVTLPCPSSGGFGSWPS